MKIVFFVRALHTGGAERQVQTMAPALRDRGHDVSVVTFYEGGNIWEQLVAKGIRLRSAGKHGRWHVLRFLWRLVRTLREEEPDIVYCMLPVQNVMGVLMRWLLGDARIVWGIRSAEVPKNAYGRLHESFVSVERLVSGYADLIISNSVAALAQCRQEGFPAHKLMVIENAIDTVRFKPRPELRSQARAAWGVDDSTPVVGIAARIDATKGHDLFFRAMSIVATQIPSVRVLVAGGRGAELDGIRDAIDRLGLTASSIVCGDVKNVELIYSGIDVLCSASIAEGFSNSIAEAMACGTRCVATDVGDSARIVGELGTIVRKPDPQILADAILHTLRAPHPGADTLHRWIHGQFSTPVCIERTESALQALLGPPRERLDSQEVAR